MKSIKKYGFDNVSESNYTSNVLNIVCVKLCWINCIFLIFSMSSCNYYDFPEIININPPITNGQSLTSNSKTKLEGIYKVVKGKEMFGDTLILKWSKDNNLSIFGGSNGFYAVTKCVKKDSSIFIYGYWRYALSSKNGSINLQLNSSDGSNVILSESNLKPLNVRIKGTFGSGNNPASEPLEIIYVRPFSQKVLQDDFQILAHRSGGRTSDLLSISENSMEMIGFTENFGSTGIEIDVRLLKDGVPVLYHDNDINIRLTQKSPLNGPIRNFSYAELSKFVRLVNGEKIPKLEDALIKIVDSTNLKVVWLDMKSVNNAMATVIPIQQRMLARAKQRRRQLDIYIGIPDAGVLDFFKTFSDYQNIESLCEVSAEDVSKINAQVWGPRWTLGLLTPEVAKMHAENRKVFCWTLDNELFIKKYINEGDFDGILTNYPTIVSYHHYLQK